MEMNIEFSFKVCCSDRFAKIYSKLIRDVKKQVGKKKLAELTMTLKEFPEHRLLGGRKEFNRIKLCSKCRKHIPQTISMYKIKIED